MCGKWKFKSAGCRTRLDKFLAMCCRLKLWSQETDNSAYTVATLQADK